MQAEKLFSAREAGAHSRTETIEGAAGDFESSRRDDLQAETGPLDALWTALRASNPPPTRQSEQRSLALPSPNPKC